jgi:hypothetical protein
MKHTEAARLGGSLPAMSRPATVVDIEQRVPSHAMVNIVKSASAAARLKKWVTAVWQYVRSAADVRVG